MGCFLTCFGFKKKKKNRRKSHKKSLSGEQNNGSYVPLDSDASIKEIHFISESHQKKEKPKKKVSFNLNVKAYEPIANDGETSMYGDEDDTIASHPVNYRYQNCRGSYEYDELKLDEEDLDFNGIEEEEEEDVDDVFSNGSYDDDDVITNRIYYGRNTSLVDNLADLQGRDRGRSVLSVLSPVENLTQWKVVKAKAPKMQHKYQKENVTSKPDDNHFDFKKMRKSNNVAVDASLSNWLGTM